MALWASYSSWRLRLTIRHISMTSAGESRASPDLSRRTASTISPIAADLLQHAGGPGLDGPGEAGRLQAGAKNQRHHIGTGSQLFDKLEPIPVRQREVNDRDVHPVGHFAHERASASEPAWPVTTNSRSRSNMKARACRNEA